MANTYNDLLPEEIVAGKEGYLINLLQPNIAVHTPRVFDKANPATMMDTRSAELCGYYQAKNNTGYQLQCFPDKNQVAFRIYISECTELDSSVYQNKLCKFLDRLSAEQNVTIYIGAGIYGLYPIYTLGNVFDAMEHCKGKITTVMNGRGSFCESVLWLFGHERKLSQYGTLCFGGVGEMLKNNYMWKAYFTHCYCRAQDLGILTENDVLSLLTNDSPIAISYADYISRMESLTSKDTDPEK